MEHLEEFQSRCLSLNAPPLYVRPDDSVDSCRPTQGYNVVTLAPARNLESTFRIDYGGESRDGVLPPGSPVPLPLTQEWGDSNIKVNNTSPDRGAAFVAGLFGFNNRPTCPLHGTVRLMQYESAGAQTSSAPMTLTLRNRSQEASLVSIIVGPNPPLNVALNTNPKDLPPQWQELKHFKAIQEQTFQISKNFFGQYVFVINASLTDVPVTATLV